MRFKTSFAQTAAGTPADNARAAADTIRRDFTGFDPAFVVFFAATDYDPATIAAEMQNAFPGAVTMGCSTAGEACGEETFNKSVVAMGFSKDVFAFSETALVLADGDEARAAGSPDVFSDATAALEYLGRNTGKKLIELDYREYVGFMLTDIAIQDFPEAVAERAGEMMNLFFTGGFAGDDYKFDGSSAVFYQGKAYCHGAVALALWKPANGFEIVKTQAVELTDKQLLITEADEKARIIWKLDGKDAAAAYAEAIGVPVEKMGSPEFDDNPLALVANGEPFLRVALMQVDGRGLQIFTQIREGTRLVMTKAKDIVEKTKEALDAKIAETGGQPAAILHINCCSRHTAMGRTGQLEAFGKIFHGIPHVAFSSYGEVYINRLAITSVMILFK